MSDREMMWLVVIHVTFVASGVLMALRQVREFRQVMSGAA